MVNSTFSHSSNEMKKLPVNSEIPDITLIESDPPQSLHPLVTDHLLLMLISTSCEICADALEALDEYTGHYPTLNVVILIDSTEENIQVIKQAFEGRARVFKYSIQDMVKHLQSNSVPWGYAVDASRRIVSSQNIGSHQLLRETCQPILPCFNGVHES
ncbi:hypothetical protein [Paenibacillus paeoniae]|uniref:hypothetical protein n=1 Tax=Paenibacillus paeoniae TaxID=2292705 RepID=UPI001058722B|nr:hypothetical protein [Paenibacillus paeoniae]